MGEEYTDILIIGSGPCALACAARLREAIPSALFTDAEHARYWKRFARRETLQSELVRRKRREAVINAASSKDASPASSAAAAAAAAAMEKKKESSPCTMPNPPSSQRRRESDSGYSSDSSSSAPSSTPTVGSSTHQGGTAAASTPDSTPSDPIILVLTSHPSSSPPQFLSAWSSRFTTLRIPSLRSPLFFHPDPRDRDGLLAFAYETGREGELTEIGGVVGREVSKHALKKARKGGDGDGGKGKGRSKKAKVERHLRVDGRDRVDYFTPSTGLFADYCEGVVERYGLRGVVRQGTVRRVRYGDGYGSGVGRVFEVEMDDGEVVFARTVIVATGPTAVPCVPRDCGLRIPLEGVGTKAATHVFQPGGTEVPGYVREKIRRGKWTRVVVVGGGLTSAQVAVNLLREEGVRHVHLLLRGKYKLKHFDVDLEWVSKTRNQRMAEFWSADTDEERAQMLREAKGGGSVSPLFHEGSVKGLVREGRLSLCEYTKIVDGEWDEEKKTWQVKTSRALPKVGIEHPNLGRRSVAAARKQAQREAEGSDEETENDITTEIDHIFFATGVAPDFSRIPFLQDLPPIPTINSLPVLTEDLAYSDDIPLFFTGALAALRLGPGAANLAGARLGAERIAWKIEEMFGRPGPDSGYRKGETHSETRPGGRLHARDGSSTRPRSSHSSDGEQERSEFTGGFANQFAALDLDV